MTVGVHHPGDNLWADDPHRLMTRARSTVTRVTLGQTVERCGQPAANKTAADLRKYGVVHNPQALLLRPTSYLPEEKVSAR